MKIIRSIIRIILGTVVFLWFLTFILPRIPAVQRFLGEKTSSLLEETLGTKVSVGRIDLQLPSRIIIDELNVADQQGKDMLRVGRVAASVDILPLFDGKIRLSSAQLFGMRAHLTQRDASSPLNCQFVIDSLQSKDTLTHTPLDLHITSFIIRHGEVTYDRFDVPQTHAFSPYHVSIAELSTNIKLNQLTDDSLDVEVKRMSFIAGKGSDALNVRNLSLALTAAKGDVQLRDFLLQLPHSDIRSTHTSFIYTQDKDAKINTTTYDLNLTGKVTPSDFAYFYPKKIAFNSPLALDLSILPLLKSVDLVLVMSVEPGKGGQKFMPMALRKIRKLRKIIDKNGFNCLIEVDGGINDQTGQRCRKAGADILVAGSYLFGHDNFIERVKLLR